MNKKGFTLIELLAVIVILAIIAVIAVPIVINIIEDSKKNASLRSAEMYMDAVELSIADRVMHHGAIPNKAYPIMSDGNICLENYEKTETSEICIDEEGKTNNDKYILKVEINGEGPTSGSIYIENGEIFKGIDENKKTYLVISEKTIEPIEENGEVKFGIADPESGKEETIEVGKMSICNPLNVQTEGAYTSGDKYECDVDPNKVGYDYTFYVLNSTSTEVNLIMNANINASGEAVIPGETSDTGLVAWNLSGSNTGGPVDAMQFLYNATKDWTNLDPISYEYEDKDYQGTTVADTSYTSFVADKGILTITALDKITTKTIATSEVPLRARTPIYSGVWNDDRNGKTTEKGEVADKTANNAYLYENLDPDGMNEPYGYWTLSSDADYSDSAWTARYSGYVDYSNITTSTGFGVRPVITLKI